MSQRDILYLIIGLGFGIIWGAALAMVLIGGRLWPL